MKSNSVRKIQPPRLRGSAMVFVLVISSVAAIVLSGLVTFVVSNVKYSLEAAKREEALQIAESGAHFYRWYIAHKLDGKNTEQMNEFWQLSSPRPYGVDTPYEADFLGIGRYRIVVTPPQATRLFSRLSRQGGHTLLRKRRERCGFVSDVLHGASI
ncbi:MAG: hypothetical protein IPL87_02415 [Candidatus Moraniibacteriota bacterium]|nr:MAG: hypothetical protein IPL87_02415 [Candidatus Moranbacteria bacterium]